MYILYVHVHVMYILYVHVHVMYIYCSSIVTCKSLQVFKRASNNLNSDLMLHIILSFAGMPLKRRQKDQL
jgi:hypothetical protein